ncbi:S9 family peptidase [Marisediminicola sp. LYQ134]|uniref:S9 family peptidase n=1 Tax=Marisediminicola sp. LYQ134 TaxID=3391061 RepID=UPI0039836803
MISPRAPRADRRPVVRSHHGRSFTDDYEWLRDKSSPDVVAHLEAENEWTAHETSHLAPLADAIFDEIKSRTLETDLSVPVRKGDHWYFTRTVEGSSYGVFCRAPVASPDDWVPPAVDPAQTLPGEEVLLDANVEAEGHDFFSLGTFDVSPDGRSLLWGVDTEGDERYTLRIVDLASRAVSDVDVIPNTAAGAMFSPDGAFVFYCTVDDAWRPDTVWRHAVGSSSGADVTVFTEPDDRFWVGVGRTRSRKYIVVEVGSKITSEVHLLDAADPMGEFAVVWPRVEGVEYDVEHVVLAGEDRLLITHNDGAENFEVVDVAAADPRGLRDVVVPASTDTRIDGVDAFAGHVVVSYRRDALTRVGILPLSGGIAAGGVLRVGEIVGYGALTELEFDEPLFDVGVSSNPEWTQPTLRLGFTSFVTPSTVLSVDVATRETTVLKRMPVLGGYRSEDYAQARDWATAADGTRVPISLVWKPGAVDESAPAPTLLYGYGSYEASMDPSFSIARLSLLDRGILFAIAHVRGGGELGRHWYDDGKTLTKRNTFTDFVAVGEHLVASGRSRPDGLVAEGRSAGGLLVGAAVNLAPDLFAGVLAGVPFVDALTSILDPELPLTVIEWDEWGDPLHDPAVYDYMSSYSPYENVRSDVGYPPILAVTSLNDTRVLYVEPAKWVAKLREVGAPALLKIEMQAGHGGVSGRYDAWRERAFEYAWVIDTATRGARDDLESSAPVAPTLDA